jgi:hypothetical protein
MRQYRDKLQPVKHILNSVRYIKQYRPLVKLILPSASMYFTLTKIIIHLKIQVMKQFKNSFSKSLLLIVFPFFTFTGSAIAGLDYYHIAIGKKVVYTRYVNKPLSLENLPITSADMNEQLVIQYFQCNVPDKTGKNRSISLRDNTGKVIKKWEFADAKDGNAQMTIPVKELMQYVESSKSKSISLYYAATGKTEDEQLAFVGGASKAVGYLSPAQWPFKSFAYLNKEDRLQAAYVL